MTDILLDPVNGGLQIKLGDLVIGDSTLQNQQHLLLAGPNDLKQHPTSGVDLGSYLLDEVLIGELRARTVREFEADRMKNVSVTGRTFQTFNCGGTY